MREGGKEGERGRERREREDGVERTHREARSHDLMNELAWLLAPWWGTRAAFTLPHRRLSSFARRLSVPWREGQDGTGQDASRARGAGERIDSNSNVGYMHDVAGLKNPGSMRIERGIDAGHGKKRETGRAKLAFALAQ